MNTKATNSSFPMIGNLSLSTLIISLLIIGCGDVQNQKAKEVAHENHPLNSTDVRDNHVKNEAPDAEHNYMTKAYNMPSHNGKMQSP
ncbi:MAG: hypothetical protein ACK5IQ_11890, partial [Bacteroidales bacterium]